MISLLPLRSSSSSSSSLSPPLSSLSCNCVALALASLLIFSSINSCIAFAPAQLQSVNKPIPTVKKYQNIGISGKPFLFSRENHVGFARISSQHIALHNVGYSSITTSASSTTLSMAPPAMTLVEEFTHSSSSMISYSSMMTSFPLDNLAVGLGYLVGAGSLILYTPIAVRIVRQGSAEGLTIATWWLKLASYTCNDIYAYSNGYNLSTYVETIVITIEALTILVLVSYYQRKIFNDRNFILLSLSYIGITSWALSGLAPPSIIALGQVGSTALNTGAIIPQLVQNQQRQSSGDYSPVTAGLAATGCFIRCFTTIQLNGSDPLLLLGFGVALIMNSILLGQILYYGTAAEGKSLAEVLTSDINNSNQNKNDTNEEEGEDFVVVMADGKSYGGDPLIDIPPPTSTTEIDAKYTTAKEENINK